MLSKGILRKRNLQARTAPGCGFNFKFPAKCGHSFTDDEWPLAFGFQIQHAKTAVKIKSLAVVVNPELPAALGFAESDHDIPGATVLFDVHQGLLNNSDEFAGSRWGWRNMPPVRDKAHRNSGFLLELGGQITHILQKGLRPEIEGPSPLD